MDGAAQRAAASIARGVWRALAHARARGAYRRRCRLESRIGCPERGLASGGRHAAAMPYYLFSFQHTVESDERTIGYASVCLNGAARTIGYASVCLNGAARSLAEQ